MEGMRVVSAVLLIVVLVLGVGLAAGTWSGDWRIARAIIFGSGISLFNLAWGFFSIQWAFHRSSRTFHGVLVGGMLLRFIVVGLALYWAWTNAAIHFLSFVVALLATYFLLQVFEIRFVQQHLAQKSSATK